MVMPSASERGFWYLVLSVLGLIIVMCMDRKKESPAS